MPAAMPGATAEAHATIRAIVADLSPALPVVAATMFGMPSVRYAAGKAFIGVYGPDLIYKLSGDAHAEALALPGASRFDPMGGRPMKQWVRVPVEHAARYLEFARAAAQTDGPPETPK